MPSSHPPALSKRRAAVGALWLVVALLLTWVTHSCLLAPVEHRLTARQLRGDGRVAHAILPAPLRPWPTFEVEVLEDGRPLQRKGRFPRTTVKDDGPGTRRSLVVYFMASDRTDPHVNGRQYVLRYPRRQLPAAFLLLLAGWVVLPWMAVRYSRWVIGNSQDVLVPPLGTAVWSVLACGVLYSLFAVQAWLPASNAPWLLALAATAAPIFLDRVRGRSVPAWTPWLAGLLAWSACTVVAGSSYSSTGTAAGLLLASAWGLLLYLALRGALEGREERAGPATLVLFVFAVGLSLARDAGLQPAEGLAALGLSSMSPPREVVNLWTTKFVGHWLVVITWCTLAILQGHPRRRAGLLTVTVLGLAAVVSNGSGSAMAMLLVSALVTGAAVCWPRITRRLIVAVLVVGVLLAPLLAAVPWRAQGGGQGPVEMGGWGAVDVRSATWELSRRLIALRPVSGWGIGASERLPSRDMPVTDALGLDPRQAGPRLARKRVLPGGHPHNAALLIWLDLGLVGVLLAAGLLVAAGRSLAAVPRQDNAQAFRLGLFTATILVLLFNYPLWEPEVLSIVWISIVFATAGLPISDAGRRALFRDAALVLLVLVVGGVVVAHGHVSRWSTERALSGASLVPGGGQTSNGDTRLVADSESWVVEETSRLDVGVRLATPLSRDPAVLRGWAYEPGASGVPQAVLVFLGPKLVGVTVPEGPSREVYVQNGSRDVRALVAGFAFRAQLKDADLHAPVTVVLLSADGVLAKRLPPLSQAPTRKGPDR